ncbi:MAG: hypothetical protein SGJ20_20810 [Planctomycetota bacterium]|nr:hypothetical protein [Planctomycetota bacterium]
MNGLSWQNLCEVWSNTEWSWIMLWFGLASLIVAMTVLMQTRWGQSQPLRKCAVLSLLAHLLLAAYATTVEIVTASAQRSADSEMQVTYFADEQDWQEQTRQNNADRPWDRFDLAVPSDIEAAAPSNATEAKLSATDMAAPLNQPNAKASPGPTAAALLPPMTDPGKSTDLAGTATPAPAEKIDVATAQRTEVNATEGTEVEAPLPPEPSTATDVALNNAPPDLAATSALGGLVLPPLSSDVPDLQVNQNPSPGSVAPPAPLSSQPAANRSDATELTDVSKPPELMELGGLPSTGLNSANAASNGTPFISTPATGGGTAGLPNGGESLLVPGGPGGIAGGGAPPNLYKDRTAEDRAGIARLRGGSPEAEAAVQAALKWLAANQSDDGRWDADQHGAGKEQHVLGHDRQNAGARADTAITGFALLAFLGAGQTHLEGDYRDPIRKGLEFLLTEQAADGNLGGQAETFAFMYSHGIATLALSEAFAMTKDKRLEQPLRKAIQYTINAQHPSTGSWRYRPQEQGDTSQLGWQLMALKSAELAGVPTPEATRLNMVRYLSRAGSGSHGGLASYRPGERVTRAMTAEALVCRQFLGMRRDNPAANEAGDYILGDLPNHERINLYYWYYGTLGMYQLQGEHWERWNNAMQPTLVKRQVTTGKNAGSWEPDCIWAGYGGRVYSTALSALCLEIYYRYLPLYGEFPKQIAAEPRTVR